MRNIRRLGEPEGDDPLQGASNFFDLGIVFALAFLLTLMACIGLSELPQGEDVTLVKNPGTPAMEVIRRRGIRPSGDGRRQGGTRHAAGSVPGVPIALETRLRARANLASDRYL